MEKEKEPEWKLHYRWFRIEAIELMYYVLRMSDEASKFVEKEFTKEEEDLLNKLCKAYPYFEYNLEQLYRNLYDVMMCLKYTKKMPTQFLIDIGSRYDYVKNELLNKKGIENDHIINSVVNKLDETVKVAITIINKAAEERRSKFIGEET